MGVEPGRPSGPRDKAKPLWRRRRSVPRQLHLGLGHPPRASVSPSAQLGSACLPGWAAPTRGPSAGPTLGSPAQKRKKETRPQPRFPSPPPRDPGLWGAPFETPCKGRRNCGVGAPTPHSTLPAAHPPNPRCRCGMALPVSVAGAPVTIGYSGHRSAEAKGRWAQEQQLAWKGGEPSSQALHFLEASDKDLGPSPSAALPPLSPGGGGGVPGHRDSDQGSAHFASPGSLTPHTSKMSPAPFGAELWRVPFPRVSSS